MKDAQTESKKKHCSFLQKQMVATARQIIILGPWPHDKSAIEEYAVCYPSKIFQVYTLEKYII